MTDKDKRVYEKLSTLCDDFQKKSIKADNEADRKKYYYMHIGASHAFITYCAAIKEKKR